MAYIEREKVLEIAKGEYYSDFHKSMADLTSLRELLEDTPVADVVEARHGKWIDGKCGHYYKQDGSDGEYGARDCLGFYIEVDNFTCPDWCENEPECFSEYKKQQNILEIANECEVIGNIHDNPELLERSNNND